MRIFRLLGRLAAAILTSAVLLILVGLLFVGFRVMSSGQTDDSTHLQAKRDYLGSLSSQQIQHENPPNIVFVLYDDLGYGDIGYGARNSNMIATPNIDRLAADGVMLSDFHSPAPVCTPSRAAYLTGRLAARAGLPNVVFPSGSLKELLINTLSNPENNTRLPAEEITLADILSAAGYATGMVGKWHMGDRSPSLPNDMGFDSYFGALYSNDMEPFALYADKDIAVEAPADQRQLTERYTNAATEFIQGNTGKPFFLYFAHNFPHDPLFVRESRSGKSNAGLFGDVMEEIDDSIGALVSTLERLGELDNTLIIITSDNGPWFLGDAGSQRGRKGNTFEGGMRVPFIAHWPKQIQAGRVEHAMAMGIDLVPTVLDMLGLPAPTDRIIDGRSILDVLSEGGDSPHEFLYYYDAEELFSVRDQRFKYRKPAGVIYSTDQMSVGGAIPQKEWLFDLEGDPRESYDTSDRNPDVLKRLRSAFENKQAEMSENKRGWL
jgi:arylsulfatase A-like enzyme